MLDDDVDMARRGYKILNDHQVNCIVFEPMLRAWPKNPYSPSHCGGYHNVNGSLQAFSVNGREASAAAAVAAAAAAAATAAAAAAAEATEAGEPKLSNRQSSQKDLVLRSSFGSFVFFGPRQEGTASLVADIEIERFRSWIVKRQTKCLTDPLLVEQVYHAKIYAQYQSYNGAWFSRRAMNGVQLQTSFDIVNHLQEHITKISGDGPDVLLLFSQ